MPYCYFGSTRKFFHFSFTLLIFFRPDFCFEWRGEHGMKMLLALKRAILFMLFLSFPSSATIHCCLIHANACPLSGVVVVSTKLAKLAKTTTTMGRTRSNARSTLKMHIHNNLAISFYFFICFVFIDRSIALDVCFTSNETRDLKPEQYIVCM